jgi:hypothetical protein
LLPPLRSCAPWLVGALLAAGCTPTVEPNDGGGAQASAQSLSIASGLRGYFPFDGNEQDESGHANHATNYAAQAARDRFGNAASALRFGTIQSRIAIPPLAHAPQLFSNAFTLSFWMRSTGIRRMYAFSIDGTGCSSSNLNIELNHLSGIRAYWNGTGANQIEAGTVGQYTDGRWHHVLLRRSGSVLELFVDAALVGGATYTEAITIGSNARTLHLGSNPCFGLLPQVHGFLGELDDLSIYDRELSNLEVQLLKRDGLAGTYSFTGNAHDESGFGNHAVLTGATATTDRLGNSSAAYSFGGQGYVRVPRLQHATSLFDGSFTLSFWALSNVATPMSVLSVGTTCGVNNLNLELNPSGAQHGIRAYWNGHTTSIAAGTVGQFSNDVWRHIALRRDKLNNQVALFVDGIQVGSTASPLPTIGSNAADLYLGTNPCSRRFDSSRWQGKLDELEIHGRALGDGEIKLRASSGMVASYRFEGGVSDDSGNGTRAIVVGGYNVTGRDQARQSAFELFGDQYIKIPPPAVEPRLYDRDFSVAFWVKSSSSASMVVLSIGANDGESSDLDIELNGNSGVRAYWNGPGAPGGSEGSVGQYANGTWHHIALVRSAAQGQIKLYVDGSERISADATTGTIGSSEADMYLGMRPLGSGAARGWVGALDDLQIYNRAISPTELSRIRSDSPLRLLSPAAGASWAAGSAHYITWAGQRNRRVRIEVTTDGGRRWETIPGAEAVVKSRFLWTVPAAVTNRARIRITAVADASARDETKVDFSIGASQADSSYTWSLVTSTACYTSRDGAGALVFADKMFLLGGWNRRERPTTHNEVWRSTNGATWTAARSRPCQTPPLEDPNPPGWQGRHTGGYAVHAGSMWLVGGDANRGHYQSDVWTSSSTDGRLWTQVTPVPSNLGWLNRVLHHTVTLDGRIWVFGGQKIAGLTPEVPLDEALYNDAWSSADGANWVLETEGAPWAPRGMIGGSVAFGGKLWLLGGGTYNTPRHPSRTYHNDVWSSSDGVSWDRVVDQAPWPARQYHSVAVFDEKMWVLAGYDGADRNDVWYSSDGVSWYELPNPTVDPPDLPPYEIWQRTHAASVFVFDNALWMVPGIGEAVDARDREVWKLSRPPVRGLRFDAKQGTARDQARNGARSLRSSSGERDAGP